MIGFAIRLGISAFGLWLADRLLTGIQIDGTGTLVVAALLYGVVNAVVRPLAIFFTRPISGVINAVAIFFFFMPLLTPWWRKMRGIPDRKPDSALL